MHRCRQIADLARCRERRPAREISRRQGLRDIAQLDDGIRHRPRECGGENERREERDETREQHVALAARDNGVEAGGGN